MKEKITIGNLAILILSIATITINILIATVV